MKESVIIDMVGRSIEDYGLNRRSNKLEFVYPRYYLMDFLKRNTKLTLCDIGVMFNRLKPDGTGDHSIVLHGIKIHRKYIKDSYYALHTYNVRSLFSHIELDIEIHVEQTIITRILECKNYLDMVKLQNQLTSVAQ